MKRFLTITLLLSLCLILCACGSNSDTDSKYDKLLQLMEQGKFDEAKAEIDRISGSGSNNSSGSNSGNNTGNNNSGSSAPKEITVEITPENWNQYFELRTYGDVELNGFGEFNKCTVFHSIISKDGLVPVHKKSNVTLEFTYSGEYRSATVDVTNKAVTFGEVVKSGRTSDPTVETLHNVGQYIGENTNDRYGVYITGDFLHSAQVSETYVLTSINVLRATGSFTYTQAN